MGTTDLWTVAVIIGLACVTVIARSFFFMSSKPWSRPAISAVPATQRSPARSTSACNLARVSASKPTLDQSAGNAVMRSAQSPM